MGGVVRVHEGKEVAVLAGARMRARLSAMGVLNPPTTSPELTERMQAQTEGAQEVGARVGHEQVLGRVEQVRDAQVAQHVQAVGFHRARHPLRQTTLSTSEPYPAMLF